MDESRDQHERRCPRLGGPVTFNYCRQYGGDRLPCWKALDCWWEVFDIAAFLRGQLSAAEFEDFQRARPKPKVTSLVELINQAKRRTENR